MNIEEHPYYKEAIQKIEQIVEELDSYSYMRVLNTINRQLIQYKFEELKLKYEIDYSKFRYVTLEIDELGRQPFINFDLILYDYKLKLNFNPFINSYFARR